VNVSLSKVFVFDLGEAGRTSRSRRQYAKQNGTYSVMVKGYSPPEKRQNFEANEELDSQIVFKMDKDASESGITKVTLVVSYLSVAALMGPLREVISFFKCDWSGSSNMASAPTKIDSADVRFSESKEESHRNASFSEPPSLNSGLHLRFVLHYPRLVFVAEEGDSHSRALVLRG
jgi:hypothetical protein